MAIVPACAHRFTRSLPLEPALLRDGSDRAMDGPLSSRYNNVSDSDINGADLQNRAQRHALISGSAAGSAGGSGLQISNLPEN